METPSTIGTIMRQRRQDLGLTQEQLAERIGGGVRQAEISRLESDRVTLPRRERLERIAAALDLTAGELLALSGWTGAETALLPLTPDASPSSPAHSVSADPPPVRDHAIREDLPPLAMRLRAAIERSREVRAQSQQLIENLHAQWGDHETWPHTASGAAGAEA